MWNNVALLVLGVACLVGGVLHIRNPDKLTNTWRFRYLTIAGLLLPRGGALIWVRLLGFVLLVIGFSMLGYVAARFHNGG